MLKYEVELLDIKEEVEGTKTFSFSKPEGFTWEEGAHIHIGLEGFDAGEKPNRDLVHHMSISSLPEEERVSITTRISSSHSQFKTILGSMKKRDQVKLFKCGNRMALRRSNHPIVLLSMGVGVATMRPMIYKFLKNQEGIPKLYNVNVDSSGDFVFKEELDKLQNQDYKNLWISSRDDYYRELKQLKDISGAIFYIVGSDGFLISTVKYLEDLQVDPSHIVLDKKEENLKEFFS